MSYRPIVAGILATLVLQTALFAPTPSWAEVFPVVPAELLAETEPLVTPGADAEVVSWDLSARITANTVMVYTNISHRLRIKVYTARGAEQAGSFSLPALGDVAIRYVEGRTTRPDGTVLALAPADVHEQEVVRSKWRTAKLVRFALPGVVAGSVIDCSWIETRPHDGFIWNSIDLSRDLPVRRLHVLVQPFSAAATFAFHAATFNTSATLQQRNEYRELTLEHVPAAVHEPYQPPERDVEPRLVVGYVPMGEGGDQRLWSLLAERLSRDWARRIRPSSEMRTLAREVAGDANTPGEKVRRLIAWCRANVENTDESAPGTARQREDAVKHRGVAELFRDRRASGEELNVLLASLALAAGLPARLAIAPDRSDGRFEPVTLDFLRLTELLVAIGEREDVVFYDIRSSALPAGRPRWEQEGVPIFAPVDSLPVFANVRAIPAAENHVRRTAELTLSEDGDAEGSVRLEFLGHRGVGMRELHGDSLEARRSATQRDYESRYPGSEVTDFVVGALHSPDSALVFRFHVRVQGYAQVLGDRLLFAPGFFARLRPGTFTEDHRRWPIEFPYAWSEDDSVAWHLPPGREPESLQAPGDVSFGPYGLGRFRFSRAGADGPLSYEHHFELRATAFPASSYASLKRSFDDRAAGEHVALTLRRLGASR